MKQLDNRSKKNWISYNNTLHEGEVLDVHAPITVYVTLPDISEGAEALQAVRAA